MFFIRYPHNRLDRHAYSFYMDVPDRIQDDCGNHADRSFRYRSESMADAELR